MEPFIGRIITEDNGAVIYRMLSGPYTVTFAITLAEKGISMEVGYTWNDDKVNLIITIEKRFQLNNFLRIVGKKEPFTMASNGIMQLTHNDEPVIIEHIMKDTIDNNVWLELCVEVLSALPIRQKLIESGMIYLISS